MKTVKVSYGELSVILSEASTLIGMRHTRLKAEADEWLKKAIDDQIDIDHRIVALFLYPDLIAPVVEFGGFTLPTLDEFLELPEQFVADWEKAVYELNPHWKYIPAPEEQEKKVSTSPGDSSGSSSPATMGKKKRSQNP